MEKPREQDGQRDEEEEGGGEGSASSSSRGDGGGGRRARGKGGVWRHGRGFLLVRRRHCEARGLQLGLWGDSVSVLHVLWWGSVYNHGCCDCVSPELRSASPLRFSNYQATGVDKQKRCCLCIYEGKPNIEMV